MRMSTFIQPLNLRAIVSNLSLLLRALGALSVLPLVASLLAREFEFSLIFAGMALFCFAVGYFFSIQQQPLNLAIPDALVVTGLAYLLFALVGSVAFLPVASFADSLFEAMSGITTTGLSVLNVAKLPYSLLFFRAYLQWIGGSGIIILSLVMLIEPGRSAFQLYASEYGEENLSGDAKATARLVLKVYMLLTLAGYLAFIASGMGFFDALITVMATVSTGGFSNYPQSIGHYSSPAVRAVVIWFMILGAIGFPAYYLLLHKDWKKFLKDHQLRVMVALIVVSSLASLSTFHWHPGKILAALFNATSALTTTGFNVLDSGTLPPQIKLLDTFLMFIGGSVGSTAGGIKIFRLIISVLVIRWYMMRTLLPEEAKIPIRYREQVISNREIKLVAAFLALYCLIILASAFILVFSGFGISDSLFECASALGTVGLSTGITSPSLGAGLKAVLIFDMWAGRVEILPLLLIFYPPLWVRKRRSK